MATSRKSIRFNGKILNLKAVSEEAGISTAQVSRIFSGQRNPSMASVRALAETLRITSAEFLTALDRKHATDAQALSAFQTRTAAFRTASVNSEAKMSPYARSKARWAYDRQQQ